jgi:hypothetical protein
VSQRTAALAEACDSMLLFQLEPKKNIYSHQRLHNIREKSIYKFIDGNYLLIPMNRKKKARAKRHERTEPGEKLQYLYIDITSKNKNKAIEMKEYDVPF